MVTFVTTNAGKVREARSYLDADVEQAAFDYPEVQAPDLATVAAEGARLAYEHVSGPIFIDDSGLTVEVLDGFPGPYSAYVEDTLGIERVYDLVADEENRAAAFRAVIAYCDGKEFEATPEPVDRGYALSGGDEHATDQERRGQDIADESREQATTEDQVDRGGVPVKLFEGFVPGTIVEPRGDGGFGYDPIFEHDGRTFAELSTEEKNAVSHRGRALARFAEWFDAADRV